MKFFTFIRWQNYGELLYLEHALAVLTDIRVLVGFIVSSFIVLGSFV